MKIAPVKSRRKRRSFPIHAYIGANGGGKSLAAVYDTLPSLAAGRPVVSTVRILDPATGEPHPLWVPLDDFRTLLSVEFCDVILDEVTGVASSRESAGMPAAVANHLVQLRRRDIALRWTAPSWKRADTIIRECSQGVTLCMGFLPEAIKAADGGERQWSSRRLFYWRTYDAATFDEWTTYRKERVKPVARALFWRPGAMAPKAYDTFDSVLSLGAVTDGGLCMDCGGKRSHRACSCPGYGGSCEHCGLKKPRAATCQGHDDLHQIQPAGRHLIEETDETPAVLVDFSGDSAVSAVGSR